MNVRDGRRGMRIELSAGPVKVFYPSELTLDDLGDWEDTMAILFRTLRRSLEVKVAKEITETTFTLKEKM